MMTTAAPPDLRRITEHDDDFRRVKAQTVQALTHSLDELAHDLKHGRDVPTAQTAFVQRHTDIMQSAYHQAYREGQHDYWQSVSNQPAPLLHAHGVAPTWQQVQRRMVFYAPSVTKMAHEAVSRWGAPRVIQMDDVQLDQWMEDIAVRVGLQADLTWSAFNDGYIDAGNADAAKPFLNVYWELEPEANHCPDCPDVAANSPYQAPGTGGNELTQTPGDGQTACGAACRCSLSYGPPPDTDIADWTGVLPADTPLDAIWPELHGPIHIPFPDESTLTHAQKAALDRFRMAALWWHRYQGTARNLPDIPELFNPENMDISFAQLTQDQQRILGNVIDALKDWIAATNGTGEVGMAEDIVSMMLSNPYPRQKGGRFGFGNGSHYSGGKGAGSHRAEAGHMARRGGGDAKEAKLRQRAESARAAYGKARARYDKAVASGSGDAIDKAMVARAAAQDRMFRAESAHATHAAKNGGAKSASHDTARRAETQPNKDHEPKAEGMSKEELRAKYGDREINPARELDAHFIKDVYGAHNTGAALTGYSKAKLLEAARNAGVAGIHSNMSKEELVSRITEHVTGGKYHADFAKSGEKSTHKASTEARLAKLEARATKTEQAHQELLAAHKALKAENARLKAENARLKANKGETKASVKSNKEEAKRQENAVHDELAKAAAHERETNPMSYHEIKQWQHDSHGRIIIRPYGRLDPYFVRRVYGDGHLEMAMRKGYSQSSLREAVKIVQHYNPGTKPKGSSKQALEDYVIHTVRHGATVGPHDEEYDIPGGSSYGKGGTGE